MFIEPIGIATIIVGIYCLILGSNATIIVLAVVSILGAAAAFIVGSANIQPAHVMLGFLALGVITRPDEARGLVQSLRFGEPGFWLAALVIYGVATAYFIPRLLEGSTQIVPLGTTAYGDTHSTVPLIPVSSNLTQSIYMVGDLICFAVTMAVASTARGFNALVAGVLTCCVMVAVFAFIDIATFTTGTQSLLAFMRNAQYVFHFDDQVAGVKRIVGSFTETSSFARTELGAFGFCATLWLCGHRPYLTGITGLISLLLVILSTSSTGLAGAPVVLILLYSTALALSGRTKIRGTVTAATIFIPMMVIVAGLWIATDPLVSRVVYDYADKVVLGKVSTDSGIERSSWNAVGWQNFIDSYGFGVGLGTARTSSLFIALLSNVGLPGAIFYGAFVYSALLRKRGTAGSFTADLRLAARNGCVGLILGDALVSATIDQGILFYVLAALAAVEPKRDPIKKASETLSFARWAHPKTDVDVETAIGRAQGPRPWRFNANRTENDGPFGFLRATISIVGKHKIKFIVSIVVGLCLGFGYSVSLPRTYVATATLLLEPVRNAPGSQGLDPNRADSELQKLLSERLLTTVFDALSLQKIPEFAAPIDGASKAILTAGSFLESSVLQTIVPDRTPPEPAPSPLDPIARSQIRADFRQAALENFMNRIEARRISQSYVMEVSFLSADPVLAAKVANAIASAYILQSVSSKLQSESASTETLKWRLAGLSSQVDIANAAVKSGTFTAGVTPDADARIIGAATPPLTPSGPKSLLITALGGMTGLLFGSTSIALGAALTRRVRSAKNLEREMGVECFGSLPNTGHRRGRLWSSGKLQQELQGKFGLALRDIRISIEIACEPMQAGRPLVLAVASCDAEDNSSRLCSNLAQSISRSGRNVTMFKGKSNGVDHPQSRATLSRAGNLADILVANVDTDAVIFGSSGSDGIAVLPILSKSAQTNFYADFRDRRVSQLVERARCAGDVLMDLPPIFGSADALALATHADAVVIVVAEGRTTTGQAIGILQQLQRAGANVIGTVIDRRKARY